MTPGIAPSFNKGSEPSAEGYAGNQLTDKSASQRLRLWLGTWYQVVIAELLCVLERRSY